jgi:hypothetical protein
MKKKYYTIGTKRKTKNTTLAEQNEKQKIPYCLNKWKTKIIHVGTNWTTKDKKYYTVGTKLKAKILHCQNKMNNKNKKYYSVRTKWKTKNTILSEQNEKQKILHSQNKMKNKKYYTVGIK